MKLIPNAALQIQKPIERVFEAIVDPADMTHYFVSESTGRLDSGKDLVWRFPEFDVDIPVSQTRTEHPRLIQFVWDPETVVTMDLTARADGITVVEVREDGKEITESNVEWALRNSAGWGNFLACLKAYVEHGIELRKGAFDFMNPE